MKYTHIIWDFNGTILNDVDTGIKSINTLLLKRNLPLLHDTDEYKKAFTFPITQYYKNVGIDLDAEIFDDIAHEWLFEYLKNAEIATLNPGIMNKLNDFGNAGIKQVVLSATEKNMLDMQLRSLGIFDVFEEILGLDDIYARSKERLGIEWRKRHPDASVLFIGDTEHDFTTASAMKADCILVACGHQTKTALLKCGCPVFDDIESIIIDI